MNKEQIIDKVYKRYVMLPKELSDVISDNEKFNGRNYTQDEFINKCKTDTEFSERWELKIEERELSDEESIFHYEKELYSPLRIIDPKIPVMPTKLITITYNDKTIESYE
jgi:hypothetical protein